MTDRLVVQGAAGARVGRPRKYSSYTVALAKAAVDCRIPVAVVAHFLGVSRHTVSYWIHDHRRFGHIAPDPTFRENLERLFGE